MADDAYATKGLAPPPAVSKTTLPMAGFLVDVYGLEELPADGPVTCLWLLHPRTRTRGRMHDIARRTVAAWRTRSGSESSPSSGARGLVALAFDMPNHGTRLVSEASNAGWDEGNAHHALDMFGIVKGGRADMAGLMDLVPGYLGRDVDDHMCLGWSLGGHCAWQAWMGDDRISTAVAIVGCNDYASLMQDRAIATIANNNFGPSTPFQGSKHFPPSLTASCLSNDPKGILFGTSPVPETAPSAAEQARLRSILDARVRGKRLLACSGASDELVPYAHSKALATLLRDATAEGGWYSDAGVVVEDRVYAGVGHRFSAGMVEDAVRFLVEAAAEGPSRTNREKL